MRHPFLYASVQRTLRESNFLRISVINKYSRSWKVENYNYKYYRDKYNTAEPVAANKNVFSDETYAKATLNVAADGIDKARAT